MAFTFLDVSTPAEGSEVEVGAVYCGVKASTTAAAPTPRYVYVDGVQYGASVSYIAPLFTYCWIYYVVPEGVLDAGPHSFYAVAGANTSSTFNFTMVAALSKPTDPTPADASGPGIDFSTFAFSWTNGGGATSYNVYLGDSPSSLNFYETVVTESYTPAPASAARNFLIAVQDVIYWRVDASDGETTVEGDVWSFDPRPAKPTNPSPADAATDQRLNVTTLSWDAAAQADTYDVYFSGYLAAISLDQAGVTCPVPGIPLDYSTEYTWRVDSTNEFGTTTGDTWSFTTLAADRPWVSTRYKETDLPVPVGTPFSPTTMYYTGENLVAGGIGRLIGAAANAIWYESLNT